MKRAATDEGEEEKDKEGCNENVWEEKRTGGEVVDNGIELSLAETGGDVGLHL